jgi:transposase
VKKVDVSYLYTMNYDAIIAEKDIKIGELTGQIDGLKKDYECKIYELQYQLDKLQRMIFGKKGERFVSAPYTGPNLFSELEGEQSAQTPEPSQTTHVPAHERKKSNQKGRQLLENLPTGIEVVITNLDPIYKTEDAVLLGTETKQVLGYRPGSFYVDKLNRNKYIDKSTGEIFIAPKPKEALEKCEAHPTLIADVVVSKFVDHIPEYRKQQQYKRDGVVIPPSTMNDWTHRTAEYLKPLAEAIKKEILATQYVQVDESTIKVMQKDKTKVGYMWVINSPQLGMSYFDFYQSRSSQVPKLMLHNYAGDLQSDGYSAYEVLEKVNPEMQYYNCWSHARRKFDESLNYNKEISSKVLSEIQKLYQIEQKCRDQELKGDQRKGIRQKESIPILEELKKYLEDQSPKQIDGTPIHKAIGYALNRWNKLFAYTNNGNVEIDNNLVENAIRPLALGRKNYLFAGNKEAAKNIAIYYTIFSSCRALNINPTKYLVWVLTELPNYTIADIGKFTPSSYALKKTSL